MLQRELLVCIQLLPNPPAWHQQADLTTEAFDPGTPRRFPMSVNKDLPDMRDMDIPKAPGSSGKQKGVRNSPDPENRRLQPVKFCILPKATPYRSRSVDQIAGNRLRSHSLLPSDLVACLVFLEEHSCQVQYQEQHRQTFRLRRRAKCSPGGPAGICGDNRLRELRCSSWHSH